MDDDLEDEIFYQSFLSHMRFLTKIMTSPPFNSAAFSYFIRCLKLYLLKPETILIGFCLLVFLLFFNSVEVWVRTVVNRVQIAVGLRANSAVFLPGLDPRGSWKPFWEMKTENSAVYAVQGRRNRMEDRFSVITDLENTGISMYGIFDGHGGDTAAEFVQKTLFPSISERLVGGMPKVNGASQMNFSQVLAEEILNVDKQLIAASKAQRDVAGTTALVALQYENKLVVANVGDSRGIICDGKGNAIPLSFDHKPQQLKERKRIKEAGGFVAFNGVWRVAGILATSRALGDYPLKDRNLIIADPDILTFDLDDLKPQFMILATDGLWDMFTNDEASAFVRTRLHEPHHGAKSITNEAYSRGSLDNITVIVVSFKNGTTNKT